MSGPPPHLAICPPRPIFECPQGHQFTLVPMLPAATYPNGDYRCDQCKRTSTATEDSYVAHCDQCTYDLCFPCYTRMPNKEWPYKSWFMTVIWRKYLEESRRVGVGGTGREESTGEDCEILQHSTERVATERRSPGFTRGGSSTVRHVWNVSAVVLRKGTGSLHLGLSGCSQEVSSAFYVRFNRWLILMYLSHRSQRERMKLWPPEGKLSALCVPLISSTVCWDIRNKTKKL